MLLYESAQAIASTEPSSAFSQNTRPSILVIALIGQLGTKRQPMATAKLSGTRIYTKFQATQLHIQKKEEEGFLVSCALLLGPLFQLQPWHALELPCIARHQRSVARARGSGDKHIIRADELPF